MTPRSRAVPYAVGLALLAVGLLGANGSLQAPGAGPAAGHPDAPPPPVLTGGVVSVGTVDTDPPPAALGPPALAALATVQKVLVHDGQEVKPGDGLIQFEDRLYRAKLDQAKAQLAAAEQDVIKADIQKKGQAVLLERQRNAVKLAEDDLAEVQNVYKIVSDQVNEGFRITEKIEKLSDAQKETRRRENLDLRKAAQGVNSLRAKVEDEKRKLDGLMLAPVEQDHKQALAKVEGLKATVAEAQVAVDTCLVKVKEGAGCTVEQIMASPGATFGPATRHPLMWLIPVGPRVVRAEVEAEFASRVVDKVGKAVTVYDASNFAVSYEGIVERVGTGFLPKRNAGDSLALNPTRVLEAVIRVTDPAPAGKPPLRVGQPVRVAFP